MKALEMAERMDQYGYFQEATELRRLAEVNAELLEALEKAQQDINWMLNERKFLNGDVFDYIENTIAKEKEQQ